MIKGMTGFGSTQVSVGSLKAIVEIKSVNHRYLDLNFYLPVGFGSLESKIRQIVQKDVQRGRFTVSVKIVEKPAQAISVNKSIVKDYLKQAKALNREFNLENNLRLADVMSFPGVVETKEYFVNATDFWPNLEKAIKKSLSSLMVMRRREGKSLIADVNDKLKRMKAQIKKIQQRSKLLLRSKKKVLGEEEYKSYQKSTDINEELIRLEHYVDEIKPLLRSAQPVGKKIDFIAQEMQRETNTIGSKLQDKTVAGAVIALKNKIEKIREQAQNIE